MKAGGKSRSGFTLIELLMTIAIIAILASLLLAGVARAKRSALTAKCKSNLRQVHVAMSMYVADHGVYPWGRHDPGTMFKPDMESFFRSYWWGLLMPYTASPIPSEPPVTSPERILPLVFHCPASRGFMLFGASHLVKNTTNETIGYGYNVMGEDRPSYAGAVAGGVCGLGLGAGRKDGQVIAPSEMIAIGCVPVWANHGHIAPYGSGAMNPAEWHNGRANIIFCDGHVELVNGKTAVAKNETARRRWNHDNKPHPEFWNLQF